MEIRPIPDCPKEHMGDRILIRCHAIKYVLCCCNSVKGVVETAVFCFSLKGWTTDICSKGEIFRHLPVYEKVTFCLSSNIHCILVCHICETAFWNDWTGLLLTEESFQKVFAADVTNICVGEQRSALFALKITIPPSLYGIFLCVSLFILHTHTHP